MLPCLGLKGHKIDPKGRTLKLKDFLAPNLAIAGSVDLMFGLEPDTDPLGNDTLGNCAIAGPGHFVRWEDQICGRPPRADADGAKREYLALSPDDDGLYAIDVMKHWRTVGLFGSQIEAFAQVDIFDAWQREAATFLLGGYFLCVNLPRSVQGQKTWDLAIDDGGSWGPHLVWVKGTNTCISWGEDIYFTNAFLARYGFDGYAVVSKASIRTGGLAYAGIDLEKMKSALALVTG
jgi:hypothetical protein